VSEQPALLVEGLRVELRSGLPIIEDLSFELAQGKILGVVGESGSGKTTVALALLGFCRAGIRISSGRIEVAGERILDRPEPELRRMRGKLVSFVPQDPSAALNPALRIGDQIVEILKRHFPDRDVPESVRRALERVDLPSDRSFQRRFPHQLSGGQQQRVSIAMALVGGPRLVVLDEPTTGLDVITQARILDEIRRLREETSVAMVYVSHDLAVVGSIADRLAVMYAGNIVEEGAAGAILREPRHPYTYGLLRSVPDHAIPRRLRGIAGVAIGIDERPAGCPFAARCTQHVEKCNLDFPMLEPVALDRKVRCFEWAHTPALQLEHPISARLETATRPLLSVEELTAVHTSRAATVVAARAVSFSLARGQSVALVGESGSGKTTIARCIAGLHPIARGQIVFDGHPLAVRAKDRPREVRRLLQIVFQNPNDSLNPRRRIRDQIARPAQFLRGLTRRDAYEHASLLLTQVRLPVGLGERYPAELSGGERQRVAIARALAARPDLLICDEITSSLDVSVQAAVLDLLAELREELTLSLLFISHDLGVVASVADRVLVLEQGVIREEGPAAKLLSMPSNEYTQALVDSAPRLPTAALTVDAGGA
jgi:peptide/nickel transport system ATP-binding protein